MNTGIIQYALSKMSTIFSVFLLLIFCHLHFAAADIRSKRDVDEKLIIETTGKSVEVLGKVAEALEKVDWTKVGTQVATMLAKISPFLGPALGGVAIIFAAAGTFIDTGKSEELKAMEAGFAQVNRRFDEIAQQINSVSINLNKVTIYTQYKTYQDKLHNVFSTYQRFVNLPSKPHLTELEEACKHHDPKDTLEWFYRHTVQKQIEPELLPTILSDTLMDMTSVLGWFKRILVDVQKAATMRQLCLGVRFPNENATLLNNAKESEAKIKEIMKKMAETEKIISELGYKEVLLQDLKSQLTAHGSASNADAATAIKKYLDEKHKWFQFGVVVTSTDNWAIRGDEKRQAFAKDSSRWVVVVWSKPGSELKAWADEDSTKMSKLVLNEHYPCCDKVKAPGDLADMLMKGIWGGGNIQTLQFNANKIVIVSAQPDTVAPAADSNHIDGTLRLSGADRIPLRAVIYYYKQ